MVEVRRWPKLGIPLTRREEVDEEATDVRLELELAGAGAGAFDDVRGLLEYASDALDDFFCSVDVVGRDMDERDGFLRNCSVDAGARSWEWLLEGLSTGSRDAGAGLGMPDGRGMDEDWSMVMVSRAIRCNA
jgi:hypothetical protein